MSHQLLEILSRLLQPQYQHKELLCPIAGLQEVIRLEKAFVRPVRKPFEHAGRVEIPDWRAVHHVEAQGSKDGKVHGCVALFHEAVLLGSRADAVPDRHGTDESLHEEFAGEGENDYVKSHEGKVPGAFAIVCRGINKRRIGQPSRRFDSLAGMVVYERVVCR